MSCRDPGLNSSNSSSSSGVKHATGAPIGGSSIDSHATFSASSNSGSASLLPPRQHQRTQFLPNFSRARSRAQSATPHAAAAVAQARYPSSADALSMANDSGMHNGDPMEDDRGSGSQLGQDRSARASDSKAGAPATGLSHRRDNAASKPPATPQQSATVRISV